MASSSDRFRDPCNTEYDFIGLILVRCPGCDKVARIVPAPGASGCGGRILFRPRRLICRGCGLSRQWSGHVAVLPTSTAHPATDPYFGRPLWLQTPTRHGWLWAYNLEHLDFIRRLVQAPLRERAPWHGTNLKTSLVTYLPTWIKRAKNRDEILRAVNRIHHSVLSA